MLGLGLAALFLSGDVLLSVFQLLFPLNQLLSLAVQDVLAF